MAATILIGPILDKIGAKPPLAAALVLISAALAVMPWLPAIRPGVGRLLASLGIAKDHFPDQTGTVFGAIMTAALVGGTAGPAVGGW